MTSPRNGLLLLAALLAFLCLAGPARADTVTLNVNRTDDQGDMKPGDGFCDSNESLGLQCTLRAAVEETNGLNDTGPFHVINVPAGIYTLTNGPLTVSWDLNLIGAGARSTIIEQTTLDRVLALVRHDVNISGFTVRGGTADSPEFFGGNIINDGGTVTIANSTITGGHAGSGAGLSNLRGSMTIRNSTIAGNAADIGGADSGAIQNSGNSDIPADLLIENSTISGNSAALVGGILSGGSSQNSVTIRNTTIAGNTATSRLDLPNGGGMSILQGTATVSGSIVANNTSIATTTPNCASNPAGDPSGTISSSGDNLESGTDCGFKSEGDIQSTDPRLGALANHGGPTDTRALLAGSPALDQFAAGRFCPAADQRGVTRPQGRACDIGAYEAAVAQASPDTVIIAGPPPITEDRTPTFTFGSTQPGTTFECSLNNSPFVPCSSPFSLPQLPAGTHTFEVRARGSDGSTDPTPAAFTFVIPAKLSDLQAPVLGRTVNAEPVSGDVFVAVPPSSGAARDGVARASQKGYRYVPLREAKQIPIGSYFNTRRGRVRLQTATRRRGKRQLGVFDRGLFQTRQSRSRSAGGVFELRLKGSSFRSCRTAGHRRSASAARHSRRRVRRVRGNARGRFRTRGRYSAATVRGTRWEVSDRCDGTLTRVTSGRVTVRDFRRRKNVTLRRGKSYLARARR